MTNRVLTQHYILSAAILLICSVSLFLYSPANALYVTAYWPELILGYMPVVVFMAGAVVFYWGHYSVSRSVLRSLVLTIVVCAATVQLMLLVFMATAFGNR